MSIQGKFGQARHMPEGRWVKATPAVKVAGIQYRKDNAFTFAHAVMNAEKRKAAYGIRIVPEPDNPHDHNALMVMGWALYKPWFRAQRLGEWHIGYIDAETAEFVSERLLQRGVPIEGELYSIYVGKDEFIDVTVIVLAPPGNSMSTLERARE